MGRIKVLPTEFWMAEEYRDQCDVKEIAPVYHRDNQYLVGDNWWFEIDGKAFTYDTKEQRNSAVKQFKYQLRVTDEAILNQRELEAITTIVRVSRNETLKREARTLLFHHRQAVSLREVRRGTQRHFIRRK